MLKRYMCVLVFGVGLRGCRIREVYCIILCCVPAYVRMCLYVLITVYMCIQVYTSLAASPAFCMHASAAGVIRQTSLGVRGKYMLL